jgi:glycosyltransferase involved in cell wall biosynthesis
VTSVPKFVEIEAHPLKIVAVSAAFPPEPVYSARTSQDIVQALADQGHDVTVYCPFPNRPAGRIFPGYRRRFSTVAQEGSYCVVRCFSFLSNRSTLLSRLFENISFGFSASLSLLFGSKYDVAYLNAWPLFCTAMLIAVLRLRGTPYVLSVQDLYPESLVVQQRAGRESLPIRILRSLDHWNSVHASQIIAISEASRQLLIKSRRIPPGRVQTIPNWGDDEPSQTTGEAVATFRAAKGIPADAVVAVYGGNLGIAANVAGLCRAFSRVPGSSNVWLLIAGAGTELEACREVCRTLGLDRVVIHSPWHQEETAVVFAVSDVLVLPTFGDQSLASVPSKLISYMLAERPVLAAVSADCEVSAILKETGGGIVVSAGNEDEIASAVIEFQSMPKSLRQTMGAANKNYALKNLTRSVNVPRVIAAILRAAGRSTGALMGKSAV